MIKTILLPTDFTDIAERAGRYAGYLARTSGARLVLLHAIEPVLLPGVEDDEDLQSFSKDLESKAREHIDAAVALLRAEGVIVEGRVIVGRSFEALEGFVRAEGIDLVVMGSHGLQPDTEPHIGTLSHQVFFLAKVPVLFVR
jgi:nucleotide-binding universal stress UspA family protein